MRYVEFPSEKKILKEKLCNNDTLYYDADCNSLLLGVKSPMKLTIIDTIEKCSFEASVEDILEESENSKVLLYNCASAHKANRIQGINYDADLRTYGDYILISKMGDLIFDNHYMFNMKDELVANRNRLLFGINKGKRIYKRNNYGLDKYAVLDDELYYRYNFVCKLTLQKLLYVSNSGDSVVYYKVNHFSNYLSYLEITAYTKGEIVFERKIEMSPDLNDIDFVHKIRKDREFIVDDIIKDLI